MPIEILMPALSPTMKEGNLANWTKKEGDKKLNQLKKTYQIGKNQRYN